MLAVGGTGTKGWSASPPCGESTAAWVSASAGPGAGKRGWGERWLPCGLRAGEGGTSCAVGLSPTLRPHPLLPQPSSHGVR